MDLTAVRDISGICQRSGEHSKCRQHPGRHVVVSKVRSTRACSLLTHTELYNWASPFLESPEN